MSEREKFEEWATSAGVPIERDEIGVYVYPNTINFRKVWQARARIAEQEKAELVHLLKRYRSETPLGHQPHMIAGEVDAILAKHES